FGHIGSPEMTGPHPSPGLGRGLRLYGRKVFASAPHAWQLVAHRDCSGRTFGDGGLSARAAFLFSISWITSNTRTPISLGIGASHGEACNVARASATPCCQRSAIVGRLNSKSFQEPCGSSGRGILCPSGLPPTEPCVSRPRVRSVRRV